MHSSSSPWYGYVPWDNESDLLMTLFQLLSIGHSVTTSLNVSNGLGQHVGSLSTHKLELLQKVRGMSLSTANTT